MYMGRIFSNPMGNGPTRILAVARPFAEQTVTAKQLDYIHAEAVRGLSNRHVTGPIEQYVLYHELVAKRIAGDANFFSGAVIVLVPGTSTDAPIYQPSSPEYQEFMVKGRPLPSTRRGVDITSVFSELGKKLRDRCSILEEKVREQAGTGMYENADPGRRVLFIPVAPVVSVVEYSGGTLRNIFAQEAETVNGMMRDKGKKPMGSTALREGFEYIFYEFMLSFYDPDRAVIGFRPPAGWSTEKYRKELGRHTQYTRLVTSGMYSYLMERIPRDDLYVFITKTSRLHDIAEKAARQAGKGVIETSIMRNTELPTQGEAEDAALNILFGYLESQILGRRKTLTMQNLFRGKHADR